MNHLVPCLNDQASVNKTFLLRGANVRVKRGLDVVLGGEMIERTALSDKDYRFISRMTDLEVAQNATLAQHRFQRVWG